MINVENISKYIHHQTILDDVSFTLEKGEILGLLGPNGAGKTTLMRIINKITNPSKGFVSFDGDLMKEQHLINIGYLPEERGLYQSMTVEKQMLFLGKLRGLSATDTKTQMDFWLEKFDISAWRKKRIEELSKGMAQKVQFICTILHEPDVLILDEPFSGFDPINIELIRKELLEFKKKGKSIIISTHNMNNVEEICDRAILINKGQVVLQGTIDELRQQHKEDIYKISFKGNMIAFANALWAGYEIIDKEVHSDDTFTIYLKMRQGNKINDLLNAVIGQVEISSVEEVLPSMENVFVKSINAQNEIESE
ncbi:ABC transporter ATP-binding protein [Brumimicrobium aurantiacum]|uniref:ATP-binding cassette domain-containing protein n=1 Tax=Brumimicrobium aurantiacum TaxID=1737063 RepID=A0A3E1F1K2_9FLAO|nr:ATP-binding cassette domain-containing protein [Brumimicrobium aurantiacum]RFC55694.1 ATP-binding cassette domain-containing protein [Brumimicrobium aurantiacum]